MGWAMGVMPPLSLLKGGEGGVSLLRAGCLVSPNGREVQSWQGQ